MNAAAAWQLNLDGTRIGLAIIDSGISEVNDLTTQGASRLVNSGRAAQSYPAPSGITRPSFVSYDLARVGESEILNREPGLGVRD